MNKIILTNENIEEVIGKQMDNVATSAEIEALASWRQSSSENETYYQHLIQVNDWYTGMQYHKIDVDNAWKSVTQKIHKKERKNQAPQKIKLWSYLGYAASFLLIIGAVWQLLLLPSLTQTDTNDAEHYATNHSPIDYQLKDGSMVRLSANSAMSKHGDGDRSFSFSGSANFDVIHDDAHPFTVHMDDIIVKDLGTVFDIIAQPSSDTVFVKVTEGIVQFYTSKDKGIMVEHGEEGMYIKSKNQFLKRSIDTKNQFLSIVFNDATFGDVIDHLAYSFRKNIELENENIRQCNITVDFTKAPYSIVKEIIEETLAVTIESRNNTLVINGNGCN
jgi:transmembrane sensor